MTPPRGPRSLRWTPAARRDLGRLQPQGGDRVVRAVERYAATGRGDVASLGPGATAGYRLRVGDWRVLFARARRRAPPARQPPLADHATDPPHLLRQLVVVVARQAPEERRELDAAQPMVEADIVRLRSQGGRR